MKTFLLGCSFAAVLFFIGCNFNAPKPAPANPATTNPAVPDKIKVQPNEVLKFAAHTKNGVQIYECDTVAPGKYGWVFKAPEGECDAASVGKQVRVDYSATYYFYTAK